MKKNCFFIFLILSVSMLFAQNIVVKVASLAPARSPWEIEQNNLAQEWSRITNGAVTLQFYSMNALGGEVGVLQKMRTVRPGQKSPLDGAVFSNIGIYELAPKSKTLSLVVPYTFRNQNELNYILDKFSPQMKAAIEEQGYVLLGWLNIGWATFFTKEEIRTPAQLKAAKLDAGGFGSNAISASFKAAGFNTIETPPDKVIQSMKTPGGLSAAYTVPMLGYASQWYKNLPYAIDAAMCPILSAFVVSKSTWESIPEQYRKPLADSVKRTEVRLQEEQQKNDRQYLDLIASSGGNLVKFTSEETALWEKSFRQDAEAMAKLQNSVVDLSFLHQIIKLLDEYRAVKK